jgi:hypothetical protein
MADDNTLRSYRSNDPYRRAASQPDASNAAPAGDPLAELARLIGQTDPFADTAPHLQRSRHQEQPPAPPSPAGDWRRHIEPPVYADMHTEPAHDYPQEAAPQQAADPHPIAAYDGHPDDAHAGYDQYSHERGEPQFAADRHYPAEQDPHAAASYDRGGQNAFYPQGAGRYGEEDYDDPPPRSRKSGLVTAVTLIGCAMLGTAGAYGYRTLYSEPSHSRAPVIVADRSPAKIVPDTPNAQPPRSQERVGAANERLVSREEQPVSLPAPATTGSPRVVFPTPVQPLPNASGAQPSAGGEPKRVRTLTIRPDGTPVNDQAIGVPPPAPESRAPATARAAHPTQVQRAAQPPQQQQQQQQRTTSTNQPLSLDPGARPPSDPPARAQPRPVTPPAPRLAAAPSNGGVSGGYVVQVSSQRSEADARASFRALQSKYPKVLNGRQPIVRRADLGAKGVYYRAMVGPFGSSGDASQFCNNLKAAGGQCIIQRN